MKNCTDCFWMMSDNWCEWYGSRIPADAIEEGCTEHRDELDYCTGHTFSIGPGGHLTVTPNDKRDDEYLKRRPNI